MAWERGMPGGLSRDVQGVSNARRPVVIGRNCERAVITAYRELRDIGTDDPAAFRACTVLYRIHHPESSQSEALRLVAEWIDHHIVRGDDGPTPGCDCD